MKLMIFILGFLLPNACFCQNNYQKKPIGLKGSCFWGDKRKILIRGKIKLL